MASLADLSPLELHREGNQLQFVLAEREDILPELPRDYERLLAESLTELLSDRAPLTAQIDLRGVPGLSSRQLGSLIALQKVLRPRFGRVPITGLSEPVRRLLALTRVDRLFNIE